MKSNDLNNRDAARAKLQQALRENNTDAFYEAFDELVECIGSDVFAQAKADIASMQASVDSKILTARGIRQLTSDERKYYQKLATAMKSPDPKQALADADLIMPETVVDSVFSELQNRHPLLSHIDFQPTGGAIKILMSVNGYQTAQWGKLCSDIVKEILAGFKEIDTTLNKLSAFLPVCKAMLELGPEWLDSFVRQVLYEAYANGLEYGIVDGTGNDMPIGMTRDVGPNVAVVGGVYPRKTAIKVTDFSVKTLGNLMSMIAVDEAGKARIIEDPVMLVNVQDYYSLVLPATTILGPDGSYRNNVLPVPMTIIPTQALSTPGMAVVGDGKRYFSFAGTARDGRIEYDDSVLFLEDSRAYAIKGYANGLPKDNNAFLLLDISGLQPLTFRVTQVDEPAPGTNADLSDLTIGALELTPAFAAKTKTYTANTSNATNVVRAVPADAGASVEIKVGDTVINNGTAATWATGSNTLTVKVTAADGTTTNTYTVTVTKSA